MSSISGNMTVGEKTFEAIFNSCVESILLTDRKGVILLANPESERLFGYEPDELPGQSVEVLIPKPKQASHKNHRADFNKNPTPRKMGVGRDLRAVKKDGTEFPIEVSLNPTEINGEGVIICFLIDITKRKKIEEALQKSEEQLITYAAQLEKKVEDRTQELKKAIGTLEDEIKVRKKAESEARQSLEKEKELNELKTRFVSMASHEFRTPLSTILSSASLINKYNNNPEFEDKREKHVERIKNNVNDLTSILNDFLSLDKLEAGKIQNNPESIDIEKAVEEIVTDLRQTCKKGQNIDLLLKNAIGSYILDKAILRHVIQNLVSNAIKYSPEDSVISIVVEKGKKGIHLNVKDQGIGIPESDQKHLFERFFRAHNSTHIQGTGLGLNLVKKYLELIGGEISFESSEGKGSTFKVFLPN